MPPLACPPQTPVIIGAGFAQDHADDPACSPEAFELMVAAVRAAATDAGVDGSVLEQIESIAIPQGLWQYRNPGRLVAAALGCPRAQTIVSDLGVLQLTPFDELCRAIARGERNLGVVVGGEAKYRDLRSRITGTPAPETQQGDDVPAPDVRLSSSDPFASDLESERGLQSPIALFAIIESALRHASGRTVAEHRDAVAELYAELSRVAAANPHAWSRTPVAAATIRDAGDGNAMQAFPYTKLHCSQWNVNRAAAVLVCSVELAERAGIPSDRWVFPLAAAESHHVVVLAQQRRLASHPGTIVAGRRAMQLAGITPDAIDAAELYSCFPAAVQSFARDLEIPPGRPLSVTGGMPFAGGPFNHFAIEGVARMTEVLRDRARSSTRAVGIVANLSGIFGKQACTLLSTAANENGYGYADVTAAVAEEDVPVPLDPAYSGPATVTGYTVVFHKGAPSHAVAICDTPAGERTVARSDDTAWMQEMMETELCGTEVHVQPDGSFVRGATEVPSRSTGASERKEADDS